VIALYLDDVRNPPDDSWTIVRTLPEAKALLASGVVEYASLDHDLGQCDACASDIGPNNCRHVGTGADLCDWMADTGHWPTRKPRVHSANPVGRATMLRTIERYFPRSEETG